MKPGRRSPQKSYTHLRYNIPATRSTDGCSTREGYPYRRHLLVPLLQSTSYRNVPAWVSRIGPIWLCKSCTTALCRPEPVMPFFALANWNWGGQLHPLYYNLSIVTKALLGLAIMICRLIVLQHSAHPEDQYKMFRGQYHPTDTAASGGNCSDVPTGQR